MPICFISLDKHDSMKRPGRNVQGLQKRGMFNNEVFPSYRQTAARCMDSFAVGAVTVATQVLSVGLSEPPIDQVFCLPFTAPSFGLSWSFFFETTVSIFCVLPLSVL